MGSQRRLAFVLGILFTGLIGCTPSSKTLDANRATEKSAPNILVILADDMGTETLASYGIGMPTAVTPNLSQLAKRGVRFERFWAQPACSPTRAAILTGRYGHRTGVLTPLYYGWSQMNPAMVPNPLVPSGAHKELDFTPRAPVPKGVDATLGTLPPGFPLPKGPSNEELMLPKILKSLPTAYATAAIGKWHLLDLVNGDLNHPNEVGFDYFSGTLFGSPKSYFAWRHVEDGRLTAATGYIDRRAVDDAKQWLGQQTGKPWFLWMSFTSPHTPAHLPPIDLLASDAGDLDPDALTKENTQPYFLAQIEAMDTLIGDLLDSMSREVRDNTYIIFLGDNGTASWDQPPAPRDRRKVKMTVYEGGVVVPLIIAGPGIVGGRMENPLAHAVDLFGTIIELAGATIENSIPNDIIIDSHSLTPYLFGTPRRARDWVLTEITFGRMPSRGLRDERYKLVLKGDQEEFYDLEADPNEENPLDPAMLGRDALKSLNKLRVSASMTE